ncbi:retron Ec67 family RNA-directed DNA polymerase/endonuclease [Clostridiisalibacter paucivorans]|uniref:retron Ec67 family RNA-directed DNA polymerase/endonuclease n=1 Tax=Clostridiisalibacter paucivorans TaxID=408753 RepID=UPI00047E58D7|nr:retron Ec67 family RNA-directed DNA polymerase/endonuclease [Clostridiisalibacter paucivorans]
MNRFYNIKNRRELASFLGIPLKKLTYILYKKGVDYYYETFEVPKRNSGARIINAPSGDLKTLQKKLSKILYEHQIIHIQNHKIKNKISHGFEKEKGIITNAEIHRNKRFVMNVDIKDFFESFHFGRVKGFFNKSKAFNMSEEVAIIIAQITCFNGKLPQGAPTSPIITNLICNILDMRILSICKEYKLDYSRYADDLTFSTNDKHFIKNKNGFYDNLKREIQGFGLLINEKKTRIEYKDSRQVVTGLTVNKKISVKREYYKNTRAMADKLYRTGEFTIGEKAGTIRQLEGIFSFINQIDYFNNKKDNNKKHNVNNLNSREREYQKFLFYRYFLSNSKPLIVTEGKTDVMYIKAALKKHYKEYPNLIEKHRDEFEFKISFLNRTKRLRFLMGIQIDGADTFLNIYNFYTGKNNFNNYFKYFNDKYKITPSNPVILIFDNEQKEKNKPLYKFKKAVKMNTIDLSSEIIANLFLLTVPLCNNKEECEIEDLFDEKALNHKIGGKKFSRKNENNKKYYGKADFAKYIYKNYKDIDFSNFKLMLDELNLVVNNHNNNSSLSTVGV